MDSEKSKIRITSKLVCIIIIFTEVEKFNHINDVKNIFLHKNSDNSLSNW